jgi:hypothetical protein
MAFSIYQASVPVYTRRLEALSAILDKAAAYASQRKIDPAALIQARLYPDMLPLARQVQIACSHAVRGAARLSGAEPASVEDKETSFDDLKARIAKTLAFLKSVDAKKMEGMEGRDINLPRRRSQDNGEGRRLSRAFLHAELLFSPHDRV